MSTWTEADKVAIKELWESGSSAREIAKQFHVSRNAICGLVNRNHWQTPNMPLNGPKRPKETKSRPVPYNLQRTKERRASPAPQPPLERDPAPSIDDLSIPIEQRKTLLELTDKTCRFPVGNPGTVDFFFCGAVPMEDRPYCKAHFLRATQPLRYNQQPRPFALPKTSVRI